MTSNEFKLSYKRFLTTVTKHTIHTADKYVSYINKASLLPGMEDIWERLALCNDSVKKTKYVEDLCNVISDAFVDPKCTIKEKDLRDSQSSAHVLLAFVSGQIWEKHKGIKVQFTAIYNHKVLRSKFLSRLTTQDRIYSFGSFPINIINGMANRRKISLFDKMIDEVKFIYNQKGEFFYFKDINRVMLGNDGHAYFEKGGKIYSIFTQIPKKVPAEYCVICAPKIDDLSLDHDNPIEKELKKRINTMPTLMRLSTDIWNYKQEYKQTHKGANNRTILSAYKNKMLDVNEDELIKEIEVFLNTLSLTIMQFNFNSSKNNKI